MRKLYILFVCCFLFLALPKNTLAAADHLVISQVQITGGAGLTTNDFVEIYNPTESDIDLQGMRLVKRTKIGTTDTSLKSWTSSSLVLAHGYYLWANSSYATIAVTPNATTTGSLADDNGVAIRQGPNDTGTIVDSVAWGTVANAFVEGTVFATNPVANQSLERKPGSGSGNGEDTNNNADDFFLQTPAHPRNSASPIEPVLTSSSSSSSATSTPEIVPPAGGGFFELELSEFLPNPAGKDTGAEWIEIYNASALSKDISGWFLDDDSEDDSPGKSAYQLPAGSIVPGRGYFVAFIPQGKFSLNNSGTDSVRLFDSSKVIKLRQVYTGPAKDGYSYAKAGSGSWEWTETVTPGSQNSFGTVNVYADALRISETWPNPGQDEHEYIELHNYDSDSIDLVDWIIADAVKKYKISEDDLFETEIPGGGYLVLHQETTGIRLNNSGPESVKLVNPAGETVSTIQFDAKGQGSKAYAWAGAESYRWTDVKTPGEKNVIMETAAADKSALEKAAKPIKNVALADIRQQDLGELISTAGIVSVPPNIFDPAVIYLAGSGIRVSFAGAVPELALGDQIQITGELSSFHNELQLKVSGVDHLQITASGIPIEPHIIKTGAVGGSAEGFLVEVAGLVTRNQDPGFFMDDGSGEVRIYIDDSTAIGKPAIKKGQEVKVIGVVSRFNDTYRVMPRFGSDIIVAGVAGARELPRTGQEFWPIVAVFLGICYYLFLLTKKDNKNEPRNTTLGYIRGHHN